MDALMPPTVNLGREVTLIEPPCLFALAASRTEGEQAVGGLAADLAYGAAALRMCWPEKAAWPVLHRPREWSVGVDVGKYGAGIFEELRSGTKGAIKLTTLTGACYQALNFALRTALDEEEVEQAQDFSGAQQEE